MTRTLHADGTAGHVYIYNNDSNPSVYENPTYAQLPDLHFHSDLSYLGNSQILEVTINHSQRNPSYTDNKWFTSHYNPIQGTTDYLLGTHSFGTIPAAVGFYETAQMPAGFSVQKVGQSVRAVSLYVTSTQVRLFENYVTFDDVLGAVSRTYKVYLFQNLFSPSGNVAISITPTLFNAGFNKLSTDYRYVRKSSTPDLYVTNNKTADVSNGGLKIVLPDGTTAFKSNNYNGSFSGSTSVGVSI